MDLMIPQFSSDIVRGALSNGASRESVARALSVDQPGLDELLAGKVMLSHAQASSIQALADVSLSHLAVVGIAAKAPRETLQANASFIDATKHLLSDLELDTQDQIPTSSSTSAV